MYKLINVMAKKFYISKGLSNIPKVQNMVGVSSLQGLQFFTDGYIPLEICRYRENMSLGNIFIHRLNKNFDGSICSLLRDISLCNNPFF